MEALVEGTAEWADEVLLDPDQLVDAWAHLTRRQTLFALAVAHVKNTGAWANDGAITMRAWMRDRLAMSDRDAGQWLRFAMLLDHHPKFAEAALEGTLTRSQLAELERLDRPRYKDLLAEHADFIITELSKLDQSDSERFCAVWRQRADAIIDEKEPPSEPLRSFRLTPTDTGCVGQFTFDEGATTEIQQAICTAREYLGEDDDRTESERTADAVESVFSFYNRNHQKSGRPRHTANVSISMDASTMANPESIFAVTGGMLPPWLTDSICCDSVLFTIFRQEDEWNTPSGFGRDRYVVPRRLWREVAQRDGTCRFPGCTSPVSHCDAHHIQWWRRLGPTEFWNLVLLCGRHHRMVHKLDLGLTLSPNGELEVAWPSGATRRSHPRGAPPRAPNRPPGRLQPAA